jgi:hypothetical protein
MGHRPFFSAFLFSSILQQLKVKNEYILASIKNFDTF